MVYREQFEYAWGERGVKRQPITIFSIVRLSKWSVNTYASESLVVVSDSGDIAPQDIVLSGESVESIPQGGNLALELTVAVSQLVDLIHVTFILLPQLSDPVTQQSIYHLVLVVFYLDTMVVLYVYVQVHECVHLCRIA